MPRYLRFIVILLCLGVFIPGASAQKKTDKTDNTKYFFREYNRHKSMGTQNPGRKQLSMQLLKSATEIKYGFNNGSVSPEYHYQGYITVTPDYVSLDIYHDSHLCYSESESLTPNQYSKFLDKLNSLGVKPNKGEYNIPDGAGICSIEIKQDDSILFKGIENGDIVTTKGSLRDAFEFLLSPGMMNVYKNPEDSFNSLPDDVYGDM